MPDLAYLWLLRFGGFGGIVYLLLTRQTADNEIAILVFAAMMGLADSLAKLLGR